MVAPRPGPAVEEGQLLGEGVGDEQRPQQPLGVLLDLHDLVPVLVGEQSVQRLALPLKRVDGPGLGPLLVDGQDQATVEELLVHVDGRGRQHDHHRPLDPVLVGDEPPRLRVLAGRCDRQLPLALQQL